VGGAAGSEALERLGVRLTHPDRVLYEEAGVTKRALADYYALVADRMLPHVAGRPLSLVRCPAGSSKQCFYQRHPGAGLPRAVRRIAIPEADGAADSIVIKDLAGLIALVQIGALEIHPWGARADDPERPDRIVFDLDPDPTLGFAAVIDAAVAVRDRLAELGLASFVKTTGGKGLHVMVPITRRRGWDEVSDFAKAVATAMAADDPDTYTATMSKEARVGRVFVDYLRNDRGATAVAAYSTRARKGATVSVPIAWEELGPALDPRAYTVGTMPRRIASLPVDPWADIGRIRQSITAKARKALGLA
jgi:bifunctional non-homologous end joining protein LigD